MEVNPARVMNEGLTYIIVNYREQIESIKTVAFFFIMLPAKIGLQGSVSPFTWGFELQAWHSTTYGIAICLVALWCGLRISQQLAFVLLLFGIFFYIGLKCHGLLRL